MAKVIEFHIPDLFPRKISITHNRPAEVIEFRLPRVQELAMQFAEPASGDPRTKAGPILMCSFCI